MASFAARDTTEARFLHNRRQRDEKWSEIKEQGISNVGAYWLHLAMQRNQRPFLIQAETGARLSYHEFGSLVSRAASRINRLGVTRVALFNDDSLCFVSVLTACGLTGVEAVLLNTREKPEQLRERLEHCGRPPLFGGPSELSPVSSLQALVSLEGASEETEQSPITSLEETFCFIFTSGTTGHPKAARFSHVRMLDAGIDWSIQTDMTEDSICYIPLPLYHGNGLAVALASVIQSGGQAVIRDRFSVSEFWSDVVRYGCSHSVYIGETWSYLLEKQSSETTVKPVITFGNGLSANCWKRLLELGWAERVIEHYGATELPAEALLNSYGNVGRCGYIPPTDSECHDVRLLTTEGRVVGPGHQGELLMRVRQEKYRGFLTPEHSEARVVRDVMSTGDLWWKSGDTLEWNETGFFTFLNRAGENLRYKGENLSHEELRSTARKNSQVKDAYFAVLGQDKEQKLVALVQCCDEEFEVEKFRDEMKASLPRYAVPCEVKVQAEPLPVTSTLKIPAQSRIKEIVRDA